MTKTSHEVEEEMESISSQLVFLDRKIHDLQRVLFREMDKYAILRKEIDDSNNRIINT
jgi:hypothetical protein